MIQKPMKIPWQCTVLWPNTLQMSDEIWPMAQIPIPFPIIFDFLLGDWLSKCPWKTLDAQRNKFPHRPKSQFRSQSALIILLGIDWAKALWKNLDNVRCFGLVPFRCPMKFTIGPVSFLVKSPFHSIPNLFYICFTFANFAIFFWFSEFFYPNCVLQV